MKGLSGKKGHAMHGPFAPGPLASVKLGRTAHGLGMAELSCSPNLSMVAHDMLNPPS